MSSPSSSSPTAAHFDRIAASYDELRPADERWWEIFDAIVQAGDLRGRRVLDLGCGTGQLAAALVERAVARVWAVDASEEMALRARERDVNVKVARAERLPFKAGWFDRAVSRMAVHLFDRPRAFAELRRVLAEDGRAVIVTMDPAWFGGHWLLPWFAAVPEIDATRFPSAEQLELGLRTAGFDVGIRRIVQDAEIGRDEALARIRGRAFSTFDLLAEDEYRASLARAEAEFPQRVAYRPAWLIAVATPA